MKKLLLTALFALATAQAAPFKFVALGDMPYKLPADYARFESLIGTINQLKPEFTIHVGDIKSGSSLCSDENFQKVKAEFDMFEQPLVYTPGDNEWTDCHREKAGEYDPIERLEMVREMFFEAGKSLGKNSMDIESQEALVENSRWSKEGVIFATLHVVGSNNGMERTSMSVDEFFMRNTANLDWIKSTFAMAKENNAPAVVLSFQADMFYGAPFVLTELGLRDTLNTIASEAKAYGKPVLLIHGDSHVLVIDKPVTEAGANTYIGKTAASKTLGNITRLQVMGSSDLGAVEVTVDPSSKSVFAFRPFYSDKE